MKFIRKCLGRGYLKLCGWRLEAVETFPPKFVMIAAPHTSNWDLPLMLATAWSVGVSVRWLGKDSLFVPPAGGVMRFLGGIPVERSASHNLVEQMARVFRAADQLILAVPPEGTRRRADHWRSGFYHIARAAQVPIGLGFLDFKTKRCGLTLFITPTDDIVADMNLVRAFYAPIRGKHPTSESEVRLKEEADNPSARSDR